MNNNNPLAMYNHHLCQVNKITSIKGNLDYSLKKHMRATVEQQTFKASSQTEANCYVTPTQNFDKFTAVK